MSADAAAEGMADARATALQSRLHALGVRAAVRGDGALAVVRLHEWPAEGVAPLRRAMGDAARAAGFTHAALEVTDELLAAAGEVDADDAACDSSSR